MAGRFITFEGPDGAGKTSVLQAVLPQLEQALDRSVVLTREPGGAQISEKIRDLILDPENTAMDARTEALLYAASRRQHLVEKILPASLLIKWWCVIASWIRQWRIKALGVALGNLQCWP